MSNYTVILKRPERISSGDDDIYVALVVAPNKVEAVEVAQSQVYAADSEDFEPEVMGDFTGSDYALLVVLDGHCDAVLFGWQF